MENLEVADAQSPLAGMAPDLYAVAYRNYTQVVLNVMMKESNQWGQSLQTPSRLQNYIEEARDSARLAEFNEDDSPVPPLSAEENSYDSAG
ncbi:MAG: hypothetical protein IPK17_18140 [Chloroflexi bacterium]|uniref:hypothetical protein n=1 Tax=Candidatus Flexifilum breve TaxID=3140694 RepID=UPI00313582AB|nr:hypothetical protein [Chloroflexota bacterium]